jgi:hypothetical protein
LLIVPHNLNGRLARLRLTAEAPERRSQDAVLLRPQARRVRDIALRGDLQHGQMPCKERLAAIEAAISLGTGTPASARSCLSARTRRTRRMAENGRGPNRARNASADVDMSAPLAGNDATSRI